MTLPPGGGKPGHIRETLKLHPHSHFLDASKERSLTAALKNKERSEAEGTVNVRDHRITGGLFCLPCMSLNFVVKVQCGNGSGCRGIKAMLGLKEQDCHSASSPPYRPRTFG